jgi:DUF4097 and DUF4098 domain-containing protein YvlB
LFRPARALAAEGGFERTLQTTGAVAIELTTQSGNVEVETGSSGQVQIVAHIKSSSLFGGDDAERIQRIAAKPPIQQTGNEIRIGVLDDPELRHNLSISYALKVPPDTQLRSHTGSGRQSVAGLLGPVELESGSGDLELRSIGSAVRASTGSGNLTIDQIRGSVRAKTGSGSIHAMGVGGGFEGSSGSGGMVVEQTAGGAVRADTGSGSLNLRGLRGSVEATAGSGTIYAEGSPNGGWMIRTGSGDVHLRFPSDASFDFSGHTSSGSITVSHPLTVEGTLGKKEIRGKVGGGGVPVEVKTGSGNIEID